MKLSKYEMETIVNYNADDQTATVYTRDKSVMRRLDTLVIEFPEIYRCIKVSDIDKTYEMPKSYVSYRRPRRLTEEQRIRLIYGEWESEISPASGSECSLTEYEVVTGFTYPVVSKYQQWYTWQAEAYKAVDTTFATYMAVYWRVTFTKYDGSEIHVYYITEGGTLLEESKIRK